MVLERAGDFDLIHGHVDRWNLELARRTDDPGGLHLPWSAGPAVDTSRLRGSTRGPRGDQRGPGPGPSRGGLDGHPPRPHVRPAADDRAPGRRPRASSAGSRRRRAIMDAIEIARLTGRRLMVAAKVPTLAAEVKYWRTVVKPALVGADVTILGELPEAERDRLVASSRAAIIPSAWPEPFGLVVIEALALGTPVLVRRSGRDPGARPRRDRWLHRGRRAATRLLRCRHRRPGPRGDPALGARAVLRGPDGGPVRGVLPAR